MMHMLNSHDHLLHNISPCCADVCVCAPKIYGSHMLQFNINDRKKREKNNVHGTIPTGNVLSYTLYIYIISTLRLYNTCGLFIYYYFLLYVIKEITKKANNSIEYRTMQVYVRFFSRNIRIPLLHDIKLAADPSQRHDPAIKITTF